MDFYWFWRVSLLFLLVNLNFNFFIGGSRARVTKVISSNLDLPKVELNYIREQGIIPI